MPRLDEERLRELDPRFWARLLVLIAIAAYVIAFVIENNKKVHLHFVLFTANVSLIWVILLSIALGVVGGAIFRQLNRRRRRQ